MPFRSHNFTIEDALASSQQTYDLDFDEWGWRDPNAPAAQADQNVRFPSPGKAAIPTTLAGLAIGPKSTVDRCWVSWDRQKNLSLPNDGLSSSVTSPPRRLSLESPLTYPQATNKGTLKYTAPLAPFNEGMNAAMQRGLLYVFAYADGVDQPPHMGYTGDTTILPTEYLDQFGVERPWPTNTNVGQNMLEPPFLHLVLNLRPGAFSPPTKRFPMNRSNTVGIGLAGGAKQLIAMLPIFGRKHVRIQMVSLGAGGAVLPRVCDFYVGLIHNVNESNVTGGSDTQTPVLEVEAGSALAVPLLKIPTGFFLDNPCADYLALYATPTGGNTDIVYTVTAED